MEFKNKGMLRIHYNGRKPIVSYLYENGELYFATSRESRKMKFFKEVTNKIEISLGFFIKEKRPCEIEILPDDEEFFDYLKKAAGLPPFVNFKKHQSVKITLK